MAQPHPGRQVHLGGQGAQLPITEVARGHASHGLVRWAVWELIEHESESVTVGYRLYPQPGWEHPLDLRTTYVLDDSGLVVTTAARNVGPTAAPFGYGAHPYLAIVHAAGRGAGPGPGLDVRRGR